MPGRVDIPYSGALEETWLKKIRRAEEVGRKREKEETGQYSTTSQFWTGGLAGIYVDIKWLVAQH